eukprot:Rmarinus@m.3735
MGSMLRLCASLLPRSRPSARFLAVSRRNGVLNYCTKSEQADETDKGESSPESPAWLSDLQMDSFEHTNMFKYLELLEAEGHPKEKVEELREEWVELMKITLNPHLLLDQSDLDDMSMTRHDAARFFSRVSGQWDAMQGPIRDHKPAVMVRDYSEAFDKGDPRQFEHSVAGMALKDAEEKTRASQDSDNTSATQDAPEEENFVVMPKELTALMRTMFADFFKEELYTLHKLNPEKWTVERLAGKYRINVDRTRAIILNEGEVEAAEKQGITHDDMAQALLHYRADVLQQIADGRDDTMIRDFAKRGKVRAETSDELEARRHMAERLSTRKAIAKQHDQTKIVENRSAAWDEFTHETMLEGQRRFKANMITYHDDRLTKADAVGNAATQRTLSSSMSRGEPSGYLSHYSESDESDGEALRTLGVPVPDSGASSPSPDPRVQSLASGPVPDAGRKYYVTPVQHPPVTADPHSHPHDEAHGRPLMFVREPDGKVRQATAEEKAKEHRRRQEALHQRNEFAFLEDLMTGGTGDRGIRNEAYGYITKKHDPVV